jgi:methyltransferase (TIGR00027 family)
MVLRPAIITTLVALFAVAVGNYYYYIRGTGGEGGYFGPGDGTAQGVAKIRHYESLHEPSSRLYHDPYAQYMYHGSSVPTWLLGESGTRWIYDFLCKGLIEMMTLRTKWFDDEIMKAIQSPQLPQRRPTTDDNNTDEDNNNNDYTTGAGAGAGAEQLIILGAGYDTRGFRLTLPDTFRVIEIDQPEVQALKIKKLVTIAKTDDKVLSRIMKTNQTKNNNIVQFIGINFNTKGDDDSMISDKLLSSNVFDKNKVTVVILEGVTQYIPKSSTADTLQQLHTILPANSILLISYVPQDTYDDPNKLCGGGSGSSIKSTSCVKKINLFLKSTNVFAGAPWITGWKTKTDFGFFLKELGYQLQSVSTIDMLNDKYLTPLNRHIKKEEMTPIEQYAVAIVVK